MPPQQPRPFFTCSRVLCYLRDKPIWILRSLSIPPSCYVAQKERQWSSPKQLSLSCCFDSLRLELEQNSARQRTSRSVDQDMEDIQARLQHDAELEKGTQQLLTAAQTREVLQAPSR